MGDPIDSIDSPLIRDSDFKLGEVQYPDLGHKLAILLGVGALRSTSPIIITAG